MKKKLPLLIPLVLILAAIVVGISRYRSAHPDGVVLVSGNIEVTDAQLSFNIPGRLEKRMKDEGDAVTAGQVIAQLEQSDQKTALSQAQANLAYAQAGLAELEAGSRPEEIQRAQAKVQQARYALQDLRKGSREQEIAAARAKLDQALAAAQSAAVERDQAQKDFDRFAALFKQGSVSDREYDAYHTRNEAARNAYLQAEAAVAAAREELSLRKEGARTEDIKKAAAALKQAEAEYTLIKAGPRQETIDQARAKVDAAHRAVDYARQQLQYTELRPPMDGVVLNTSAEPGEFLNPGSPVLTIGDLQHPWLRAYLTETDLGLVKLGDATDVSIDAYPDKVFTGRLSYISGQAEFTPKAVQTFDERVKLMYRIKISLDNPKGILKPGMPADARIKLKESNESAP